MADLWTVGKVAQILDVPEHRIHYLFRARKVRDVRKVGGRRLFTREDVRRIREALGLTPAGLAAGGRKREVREGESGSPAVAPSQVSTPLKGGE